MGSSALVPVVGGASVPVATPDLEAKPGAPAVVAESSPSQWKAGAPAAHVVVAMPGSPVSQAAVEPQMRALLDGARDQIRAVLIDPRAPDAEAKLRKVLEEATAQAAKPGQPAHVQALWQLRVSSAYGALYSTKIGGKLDGKRALEASREAMKLGVNEPEVRLHYARGVRGFAMASGGKQFLASVFLGVKIDEEAKRALELLAPMGTPLALLVRQDIARVTNDQATFDEVARKLEALPASMAGQVKETRELLEADRKRAEES